MVPCAIPAHVDSINLKVPGGAPVDASVIRLV